MGANCELGEPRTCGQSGTFYQYYGGLDRCGATNVFTEVVDTSSWDAGETRGVFAGRLWLFGCCWTTETIQIQILNSNSASVLAATVEWLGTTA